jgi:hypothetical protein
MPDLANEVESVPYLPRLQAGKRPQTLSHLEHHGQWRRLQTRVNTFEFSLQRDRIFCLELPGCEATGNRLMILMMLCKHLIDE